MNLAERHPENIVICIDTSRSMYRTDYKPNRLKSSIDAVKKLAMDLGMPEKSDVEITDADIDAMVDELYEFQGPILNIQNPRQVNREDARRIYTAALGR